MSKGPVIEKAAELGFCLGVRRAIDTIERTAQEVAAAETLGPIVHNQQVTERLAGLGISIAPDVSAVQCDTVVVSSHGVSPQVVAEIEARGLRMVDTTCPFVRRVQLAARRLADAGFSIVIYGDEAHPEINGVLGWAQGKGIAALELPQFTRPPRRVGILSQTTQSFPGFLRFVSEFSHAYLEDILELRVLNTICDATLKRQQAALELARRADLVIVVGSRHSANTRRLAELCTATGVETHHIERAEEIDPSWLIGRHHIGVTAGASTPDEVIDQVIATLKETSPQ
ncbi:MAG: 4-hydroxy-3-methylbut-2-enyl diphosphate reductase [Chloroflexota bacterium]|nr:4-hydroxy-3-methylbut-2-enyl diphosphate reductase [Chloroflexota bacterium]